MTKAPAKDDTARRLGRAFALLRERAGMTQDDAAAAVEPSMTPQYWGMHENGRVAGLYRPEIQAKLLRAVNATTDQLEAALAELGDDGSGTRIARLTRELTGGTAHAHAQAPAGRQAVFPLPEGDVVISIPANLTPAGFKQLEDYLAVFLRSADPAPAPAPGEKTN